MHSKSEILNVIKNRVLEIEPSAQLILFGSRARGEAEIDSDWDVLILLPSESDLKIEQVFRHMLFEIELEMGISISTFVKSQTDWDNKYRYTPFYNNVIGEGINL